MLDFSFVIAVLGAFSAFLFTVSCIPSKSPLARTLEQLESRSVTPNMPENGNPMERFVTKRLPEEQRSKLAQMLLEAGWYTVTPAQIVLRMAAAAIIAIMVLILYSHYVHFSLVFSVLFMSAVSFGIIYAPISFLHRAMELRKEQTQIALPDFLDMIASTVKAGLSINAALAYAVDSAPGALGDEIKEALAEIRLGRSRAEALKAAAERLNQQEFTTTVSAITQAEKLGSNIGNILSELAEDVRTHRILMVEEHAAKLPVKMVFPMAFFLLPCLFVIIFGSLIINYLAHRG